VLGEVSGATDVHMVLCSDEQRDWLPPPPADGSDGPPNDVGRSAPVTVLRYVERVREPLVVADVLGDDRFARDPYFAGSGACSLLAVPVLSRGALRAVLVLENRLMRGAFTTERLDAVKLIAGQLAVSLENTQVYAELRRVADELAASRARVVATADETRRRIVRDLHDGAQNRLVQVIFALDLAEQARDAGHAEEAGELYAEAVGLARQANVDLRELSHGILPSALVRDGLAVAVDDLVDRIGVPVKLDITSDRFAPEIESNLYFAVAEALTNIGKHAGAQSGTVTIRADEDILHVEVRDDGVGGADVEGGGLRGIADRVAALGGRLRVESPRGGGTRVISEVPLER
jgi:signal transduction histidine kinase